ncbi:MAG: CpsD/CapB family tyrosine-protein kinase, partial [Acidaminococcaceae bacterium]|nr:CpsD/CapB family tyrosine-protein kinase [Acidaminococcaceae bacterium]
MEEVKQETAQQQKREIQKINVLAFKDPKSPVAEAYRTIRTNLQFSGVDKEMKVVEVTSAVPNEGKSTVMASLAVVLAQARKKVLLMDCDFRNPTQHKLFGLHNRGLTNFMANGDDYTPFIQRVEQENLDILVSGPVAPNPSEMLMSNKMQDLLDGKSITASVKESLGYGDLKNHDPDDFWTLLLYTGCLTFDPAEIVENSNEMLYRLYIPNQEIKKCFESKILDFFRNNPAMKNHTEELIRSMFAGDAEQVENHLNRLLGKYVSIRDFTTNAPKENYYHGFMNGLLINGSAEIREQ